MAMQAIDLSLADVFPTDAAYCFLVGSGISIDPPSNLPAGYQFTQSLLAHLLPHDCDGAVPDLTDPHWHETKREGRFLRFEQLMGFLQESVDPDLHVLDCLADSTQPNANHLFLASLITKGCPVFTTNFDGLIEYALMRLGIGKSRITPVIHRCTWEEESIPGFPVYKLHGSLQDCCSGADTRSSIQATIEQIVQNKHGDTFVLEAWKMAHLRRELQQRDLVVLGYSGLDDFDVLPALRTITSDRRLIWVSHAEHIPVDDAIVACPSDAPQVRGDDEPPGMQDKSRHVLQTLASTDTRDSASLVDVRVNTRALLAFLSQHWSVAPAPTASLSSNEAPHSSAKRYENLQINDAQRWFLLGNIWFACGDLDQALLAYNKSVSCDEHGDDHRLKPRTLGKIATVLESQGKLDEALSCLKTALDSDRQHGDLLGAASRLNNIGFILYGQGRFRESEQHYRQALSISERIEYMRGRAFSLTHMSSFLIAHNRTADALDCCRQALLIDEEVGDISGKATCLTSMGFIHKTSGDLDQAMECYQQALEIREQIGDLLGTLTLLNNIGNIHNVSGRSVEAVEYFEKVLDLNESLGDMNMMANVLGNIGNVWYRRRELEKALKFYRRSYAIFSEHGYEHQAVRVMEDIQFLEAAIRRRT